MLPIRECSEKERNKRALLVLHGLTYLYPEDSVESYVSHLDEDGEVKYKHELHGLLYSITHATTGCNHKIVDSKCPIVQNGLDEIERLEKLLTEKT